MYAYAKIIHVGELPFPK